MKCFIFLIAIACVFPNMTYAYETPTHCKTIRSAQDILQCALNTHPDVMNAQLEKLRDDTLVSISKQRQNPEFEGRILKAGQSENDTNLSTEGSILQTFELGGKRKSRIHQSKIVAEQTGINVKKNQEAVALETVLALHRLRQIKSELERINETLTTFDKILATFKARPKLTPEQDVSRFSFNLAREEYLLKRMELIQEHTHLTALLTIATSISSDTLLAHLPQSKNHWPQIEKSTDTTSADLQRAYSEKNLAQANLALARARAWPDVKIGPSFNTDTSHSSGTHWLGGISFSLPLPLLSLNRGEKAFAKAEQVRAQTNLEISIKKNTTERALQVSRYQAALEAFRSTQHIRELSSEHKNIEDFFEKGLVPSTLVIETHRQLYEIIKTQNEQELVGIDALWRIYIIDGRVFNESI